ncbi:snRNA transcription by RNA polymerase II [Desmophyllum pertusum]|uniref:snRNA transcription by RNA polymerase II n=1 Tax=Desmophyllum pertusum TaxID=174260 RepID=A0A9X0D3P5_9CNID|nr:snRNA transcription by RNA polymerase II [Desmophyllum pertusum]
MKTRDAEDMKRRVQPTQDELKLLSIQLECAKTEKASLAREVAAAAACLENERVLADRQKTALQQQMSVQEFTVRISRLQSDNSEQEGCLRDYKRQVAREVKRLKQSLNAANDNGGLPQSKRGSAGYKTSEMRREKQRLKIELLKKESRELSQDSTEDTSEQDTSLDTSTLENDFKGGVVTGRHGDIYTPQGTRQSSDKRSREINGFVSTGARGISIRRGIVKTEAKYSIFRISRSISIPLRKANCGDEGTAEFQLDCSAIPSGGRQGGMDCVQQPGGSNDIRTVGTITHKINVKATDDSYQMTQQRMKEAEEERKGVSTKVINTPKKGSKKVFKSVHKLAVFQRQIRSGTGTKISSSPNKTIRERVIHLLAVRPYKKLELIYRLNKDGVNLKDKNSLTGILQQVAGMTDNQYRLFKHLYSEVQVETWPGYSETEKQVVRRKMKSDMNDSSLVTSSSSSSPPKSTETNKQTSKRLCPSEAERSSKKQRISHIKNNNNIIKDSVDKRSSSVNKASPTESMVVSLPIKKEVIESSSTGNLYKFTTNSTCSFHCSFQ